METYKIRLNEEEKNIVRQLAHSCLTAAYMSHWLNQHNYVEINAPVEFLSRKKVSLQSRAWGTAIC